MIKSKGYPLDFFMQTIQSLTWRSLEIVEQVSPKLFWSTISRTRAMLRRVKSFKKKFYLDLIPKNEAPFVLHPKNSFKASFREKFLIATGWRPMDYNFKFERDFTPIEMQKASTEALKILREIKVLLGKSYFDPKY